MVKKVFIILAVLLAQAVSGLDAELSSQLKSKINYEVEVAPKPVANKRAFDRNAFPGDYFYVWFCFWCHNGIQVRLTQKSAREIEKNILEKSYIDGLIYVRGKFSFIPTDDGEEASSEDIKHAAKVLRDGFDEFRKALQLATPDEYIFIQTYRSYNYWQTRARLEPENQVIYPARRPQIWSLFTAVVDGCNLLSRFNVF